MEKRMSDEVHRRFGDEFTERITSLVMGLSRAEIAEVLDREIRSTLDAIYEDRMAIGIRE
jgi:hypothetical protein